MEISKTFTTLRLIKLFGTPFGVGRGILYAPNLCSQSNQGQRYKEFSTIPNFFVENFN